MTKFKALTIDNGGSELRIKPDVCNNRLNLTGINLHSGTGRWTASKPDTNYLVKGGIGSLLDKGGDYVINNKPEGLSLFSQDGVDDEGADEIIKLRGPFYKITEDVIRVKDVRNKFHLINVVSAPKPEYKGYFGVGLTAEMYTTSKLEMSGLTDKTETVAFYQRFIIGIAISLMSDKDYDGIENGMTLEIHESLNTPINVVLGTNIPIKEHSGAKEAPAMLKSKLAGTYVIKFPLLPDEPQLTFTLNAEHIGVLPEGGVVITSLRKDISDDEYSLIADIGHVSSDYAIYKGMTLLGNSVMSSMRAGSALQASIRNMLIDNGYAANEEIAVTAMETGFVMQGKNSCDVSELVKKAKLEFVRSEVKADLIEVFRMSRVLPAQIANFIPIGAALKENARTGYLPYDIVEEMNMKNVSIKSIAGGMRYANINAVYAFTARMLKAVVSQENKRKINNESTTGVR